MTRNTLVILVLIEIGLSLLVGAGAIYLARRDGDHSAAPAVSEAVSPEFGAESEVRTWFSRAVSLVWALFVFLVIWLAVLLWWFLSRVAYADSNLMRLADKLPIPDEVIPDPRRLPIEGD